MTLQLGDIAPNFKADTTEGPIDFYDWSAESWVVLFSHPKNFTPVCTTELGYTAKLKPDFERRNVKAIGLSVDPLDKHDQWSRDIAETQGATLNFPLIADADRSVSNLYGMIHPNASDTLTVRSVFVIGPDRKIKLTLTYPASTGRNFDEVLRVIDSLQLTAKHQVATPVNWKQGEDVIIVTSVSDEDAHKKYPGGFKTLKPYLRTVAQPADYLGRLDTPDVGVFNATRAITEPDADHECTVSSSCVRSPRRNAGRSCKRQPERCLQDRYAPTGGRRQHRLDRSW